MSRDLTLPQGYNDFLGNLKTRTSQAQLDAALDVNRHLVSLYWSIGRDLLERQGREGWGAKTIERLATDLRRAFPDTRGFSERNLRNMRDLAREFPDTAIWQRLLPNCPWGHLIVLMQKLKDPSQREWYLRACLQHGWSRNLLQIHIETNLHDRQGRAVTNFPSSLPPPQSDLAQEIIKDPYKFEFLTIADEAQERLIERGLIDHIRDFLLELGQGFAFMGSQVLLNVGGEEFYVDLLFYHVKLRCYVVIELKAGAFKPEYAGKLNFYLSAVDDLLRHPEDQPSIGIILCRGKNRVVAEYALRGMTQPLGVSDYELTKALPEKLKGELPSVEQLEAELEPSDSEDH